MIGLTLVWNVLCILFELFDTCLKLVCDMFVTSSGTVWEMDHNVVASFLFLAASPDSLVSGPSQTSSSTNSTSLNFELARRSTVDEPSPLQMRHPSGISHNSTIPRQSKRSSGFVAATQQSSETRVPHSHIYAPQTPSPQSDRNKTRKQHTDK